MFGAMWPTQGDTLYVGYLCHWPDSWHVVSPINAWTTISICWSFVNLNTKKQVIKQSINLTVKRLFYKVLCNIYCVKHHFQSLSYLATEFFKVVSINKPMFSTKESLYGDLVLRCFFFICLATMLRYKPEAEIK